MYHFIIFVLLPWVCLFLVMKKLVGIILQRFDMYGFSYGLHLGL